jgi:serine-type D-Ala-D-Ala endopeptidase (penicillin-binding protein 7)
MLFRGHFAPRLALALMAAIAFAGPAEAARNAKKKASGKHVAARAHHKRVVVERIVPAVRKGQPNVQALASLVVEDSGRVVHAHNPDKERPIASISKLAAMLAIADRNIELEGLATINKSDAELAKGGAKSRLLEGMTLSNRDLLHAALMGSDNRAVPALGRSVKLNPTQLTAAMNAKARALGLKNTRFHEPTGLSVANVSTPRETIAMLKEVIAHPVLGPITRRDVYDAHPVGKPPIRYVNTDRPAARRNVEVLGGKTGYNDVARYCLVIGTRVDGHTYFMSFLGNEGKMTRFGDVARAADWIVSHPVPTPGKAGSDASTAVASAPESSPTVPSPLPVGVAAPPPEPASPVATTATP